MGMGPTSQTIHKQSLLTMCHASLDVGISKSTRWHHRHWHNMMMMSSCTLGTSHGVCTMWLFLVWWQVYTGLSKLLSFSFFLYIIQCTHQGKYVREFYSIRLLLGSQGHEFAVNILIKWHTYSEVTSITNRKHRGSIIAQCYSIICQGLARCHIPCLRHRSA